MTTIISWERDEDGVVLLTMDDPTQSANTVNAAFVAELAEVVARLQHEREEISGVILASAKKTFLAGGDLNEILALQPEDGPRFAAHLDRLKAQLRALETLGRPVVSIISGAAMGGGLELALATHHRIALDAPGVVVGLPEVGLGLMPAAGGIVRTVRMLGVTAALEKVLLSGRALGACDARELGLIDEVVSHPDDLLTRARSWIRRNPEAAQPWDVKGFSIPGGTPARGALAGQLPLLGANLRKRSGGAPAPAERAILAVAVEGSQVDLDTACRLESRHFVQIAAAPIAKNKMKLNFVDVQQIRSGASRPTDEPAFRCERLGVIGAGMMGAGIAYVAAKAGIDVVLVDTDLASAERGKSYAAKVEAKRVAGGRTTPEAADALMGRIRATADLQELDHVDFLVEAVYENAGLKADVFARAEKVVPTTAVLGSNTSTLPISELARAVGRPADFIGVHFFSPVDKMPLVEIIKGDQTSPATLAKAFDLVRQIGKTPIVVNDGRGFFTSRVIIARLNEAVAMLGDGVPASSIEQASLQAGYPAGSLQLLDELTLTLPRAVREEAKAAATAAGEEWVAHPGHDVFDQLIDVHHRAGRVAGGGFYEYDESGRRTNLWPGLREHFGSDAGIPEVVDLRDRLLFAEALEAWSAHTSGVIEASADANVGSLLGIGFPAWTGGVLRFVTEHPGGVGVFVDRARELAASYGDRFLPPASLLEYAEGLSA